MELEIIDDISYNKGKILLDQYFNDPSKSELSNTEKSILMYNIINYEQSFLKDYIENNK